MGNKAERDEMIVNLYRSPMTLQEIGTVCGLTRERVRQILAKNGVKKEEGGDSVKVKQRHKNKSIQQNEINRAKKEIKDKKHKKWVIDHLDASVEELAAAGLPDSRDHIVCRRYVAVRFARMYHYNEPFISYLDWVKVWEKSGHFNLVEGTEQGWCMVKKDKKLGWSFENAKIIRSGSWLTGRGKKSID